MVGTGTVLGVFGLLTFGYFREIVSDYNDADDYGERLGLRGPAHDAYRLEQVGLVGIAAGATLIGLGVYRLERVQADVRPAPSGGVVLGLGGRF